MRISGGSANPVNPNDSVTFIVNDQTMSGNLDLNLLNQQAGATYDLGTGTDSLHLNGSTGFTNVVWVRNVENVDSTGPDSDQIHILGNAGGTTTVTAGGGADQIWASADADHFRFTAIVDSPNNVSRDVIFDFQAGMGGDVLVFDHIPGLDPSKFSWTEITSGSTDIVLIDINGDGTAGGSYEMAIQLENHIGQLTIDNFMFLSA